MQKVKTIELLLGLDELFISVELELSVLVDPVLKVFVGLEPLQCAPGLADQFLSIGLFSPYRCQPFKFLFGLLQASIAPSQVSLLAILSAGNYVAFTVDS